MNLERNLQSRFIHNAAIGLCRTSLAIHLKEFLVENLKKANTYEKYASHCSQLFSHQYSVKIQFFCIPLLQHFSPQTAIIVFSCSHQKNFAKDRSLS